MIERKYQANTSTGGIAYLLAIGQSVYEDFRFVVRVCTADGYLDCENELVGDFDTLEQIDSNPEWTRIY